MNTLYCVISYCHIVSYFPSLRAPQVCKRGVPRGGGHEDYSWLDRASFRLLGFSGPHLGQCSVIIIIVVITITMKLIITMIAIITIIIHIIVIRPPLP